MSDSKTEQIVLAGGCFWCIEAVFDELKGVDSAVSGYAGGFVEKPSYKQVCTGTTGHAEAVEIRFDPKVLSFHDLLDVFFTVHDPTTLDRQGNDVGTQYRSGLYYYDEEQKALALASRDAFQKELEAAGYGPITTEIAPAPEFYFAEDYHQQYLAKNPNGYCGLGGTGVSCPTGLSTGA